MKERTIGAIKAAAYRARKFAEMSPEELAEYQSKARARTRAWRIENPEKAKLHDSRVKPPEKMQEYRARWREKNPGYRSANDIARSEARKQETAKRRAAQKVESYKRKLERNKVWLAANRERYRAYKAKYHLENAAKIATVRREWDRQHPEHNKQRRATDIQFAIAGRLRTRMKKALRSCGARRSVRISELIGCSVEQFLQHIERQFPKGMTWDNRSQWHLDHIRPVVSFDLTDPEQQLVCFHFTNIRPLWKRDNLSKNKRIVSLL